MPVRAKLIYFLSFLFLFSCQKKEPDLCMYFWRSGSPINQFEQEWLKSSKTKFLYIRLFDVDLEGGEILPKGVLNKLSVFPSEVEIIPTIYITNRTFSSGSIDDLPQKILSKIESTIGDRSIKEVQFDCDWTPGTKDAFFNFLESFQALRPDWELSSTIRLHQLKYPDQTGTPPVDRGMLMFYNMSNLSDPNIQHYILDLEVAESYATDIDAYPLTLDIALPLYSQGVLIRSGQVVKLLTGLQSKDINEKFEKLEDGRFICVVEGFFEGVFLNEGDIIRLEEVDMELLSQSVKMLSEDFGSKPDRVVFYHLDEQYLKALDHADFSDLLSHF